MIPVNTPVISEESKQYVNEALDTAWISSAGPFVSKFEQDFAKYIGVKHAVTVNNGTAALHVALLALGIGEGDEVIVPAFTMASSWLAILYTGATPVFVDCNLDDYNIDVTHIESKITSKTKAIMPVHIYGHSADMDPIMEIAHKHNISVIEDAAESHGGEYNGAKTGSIGNINCFSFYANKIITTGEGGMVVTSSDELANYSRKLRDLYHSDTRFIHEKIGYNYRMTNLQAALGLGELQNIDKYLTKKQHMSELYAKYLGNISEIILPSTRRGVKNVYWMYAIRLSPESKLTKDQVRSKLKEKGVDTRDFFYSPLSQPILSKYLRSGDKFPNTEIIADTGFYLPSGLAITDEQVMQVSNALIEIIKG